MICVYIYTHTHTHIHISNPLVNSIEPTFKTFHTFSISPVKNSEKLYSHTSITCLPESSKGDFRSCGYGAGFVFLNVWNSTFMISPHYSKYTSIESSYWNQMKFEVHHFYLWSSILIYKIQMLKLSSQNYCNQLRWYIWNTLKWQAL